MNKIKSLIIIGISIFFFACAEQTDVEKRKSEEELALEKEAQEPMLKHQERAYYPIPSPEQMFSFISDAGVKYSKDLINPYANYQSYITPDSKALNFGVYTADLAYSSAYQDVESTLELYKVVKTLGSELNIEDMMSEEMMENMQSHLQDKDSLAIIAGQSYYQAVDYLENNHQEGKLALMSLGGWIESLYITLNSVEKFDEESETAQRIADQKITFGNLYTYLKKYEDKVGVVDQLKAIQKIRSVFGSLQEKNKVKVKNQDGSKLILGGGSTIIIKEEQFTALKESVNTYRNSITKTN